MNSIVTKEDLIKLRVDLLSELKKLLAAGQQMPRRKWLKSHEVRRLLIISPGTLQNLRVNGTLPFIKIGGVMYYDYDDIEKMLMHNKVNSKEK